MRDIDETLTKLKEILSYHPAAPGHWEIAVAKKV